MTAVAPEPMSEWKALSCLRTFRLAGQTRDPVVARTQLQGHRPVRPAGQVETEEGERFPSHGLHFDQWASAVRAQVCELYKVFGESDTSMKPAFLVPLFSPYELVVKTPE